MTAAQADGPSRAARTDPLSRDALFRQVGSLVGVALLGFLSMSIRQVPQAASGLILWASTLTVATVAATVLIPWHRLPAMIPRLMPFVYLYVTFMAQKATGGIDSPYTQLAFLPVLWVAVYGEATEVGATIGGAAIALALPLLWGKPTEQEWVRTFALIGAGGALGFVVHRFFAGLRHQTSRLRFLAGTDPLTGTANRRAWDEELTNAIVRAGRDGWSLSVALLDLDDFKGYNDRNGHQAGDRLLKEVAAAWQGILRASDTLARIGGDEFGLLLPGCDNAMAGTIAERLRLCVPEAHVSVGVATWDRSESGDGFLARADRALYEAKERGRGRVVVLPEHDPGPDRVIPLPEDPSHLT
jgi:diguanylate cyclase (GGDEF)-like protein